MSILLIGLNHQRAPVDVRERLAFSDNDAAEALDRFAVRFAGAEGMILSTCNRIELLVAGDPQPPDVASLVRFLAAVRNVPAAEFEPLVYIHRGDAAVRHLFRVVSGLDAMVLGDVQVASQVKAAYALAHERGRTGWLLNRLCHHAFTTAKRVRSQTRIGQSKVSVPSVAAQVASGIHGDIAQARVLVIGAGETARLLCDGLMRAGARRFLISGRGGHNARQLAERCAGEALSYEQAMARLDEVDILVTATNCPHVLIGPEQVHRARSGRGGRPLHLIDLSVPRNIDPAIADPPRIILHDVDGLGRIAADNHRRRCAELPRCEAIIEEQVEAFARWRCAARAGPMIQHLYRDARTLRDDELARCFNASDLTESQRHAVERFADRLVNKLLHPCAGIIREHRGSPAALALADALHRMAASPAIADSPTESRLNVAGSCPSA